MGSRILSFAVGGSRVRALNALVVASTLGTLGLMFSVTGCKQTAPVVNITTGPNGGQVTFDSVYDINEGSALDLVVDTGESGSKITTSALPPNAMLSDGIFTFTPDYTQAGLYSITFTITTGTVVTVKTIGVRVLNVIHVATPPVTVATEGSPAPTLTFESVDPPGTVVIYSADVSNAPGAAFDPVSRTLTFTPSYTFLDGASSSQVPIIITAQGQELDTGKMTTSTAQVTYQVNEASSFALEIYPLFAPIPGIAPTGGTVPTSGSFTSPHNCANTSCHGGATPIEAMDLSSTVDNVYNVLKQPVSPPGSLDDTSSPGTACSALLAIDSAWQKVAPGDLNHSLLYWKILGANPDPTADQTKPPCGVQMPNNLPDWYLTVASQTAWNLCSYSDGTCEANTICPDDSLDCKVNAPLVRKVRLWILAGAIEN